jgi:hypothetical protein
MGCGVEFVGGVLRNQTSGAWLGRKFNVMIIATYRRCESPEAVNLVQENWEHRNGFHVPSTTHRNRVLFLKSLKGCTWCHTKFQLRGRRLASHEKKLSSQSTFYLLNVSDIYFKVIKIFVQLGKFSYIPNIMY